MDLMNIDHDSVDSSQDRREAWSVFLRRVMRGGNVERMLKDTARWMPGAL